MNIKEQYYKYGESLGIKVNDLQRLKMLSDKYFDINWIAASEKLPTEEDNGEKVLIFRIMNGSQESLAISIHDTNMVKHCNPNETWWMELPKPPKFN